MKPENLNTSRILELYHQAKCEVIEAFDAFTMIEAENPVFFFSKKHKLNKSLSVIDTIVINIINTISQHQKNSKY